MNLITDRTQKDVEYTKQLVQKLLRGTATSTELQLFLSGQLKGSYDYTDLNRVTQATISIVEHAKLLGYAANYIEVKVASGRTEWCSCDQVTISQMDVYLCNIKNLQQLLVPASWRVSLPEDMRFLDYTKANNIEKALLAADKTLVMSEKDFYYSGEIFSGEVV